MTNNAQPDAIESDEQLESADSAIDWRKAQKGTRLLLEAVGEDPNAEQLQETWERRVPATVETLTAGARPEERPELETFPATTDELVIKTGIPLYSLCEHHLLPYIGEAHIAYRPAEEAVGLSKLTRYVRWQSRQLTMQEQLTADIATGLAEELETDLVSVEITATHLCEAMRGIETTTDTTTSATVGQLTTDERQRFRDQISTHD